MVKKKSTQLKVKEPPKKFYTCAAFKRKFGIEAKKAKMKVRDFKYKGKSYKGVFVVNPTDEGIFTLENSENQECAMHDEFDDGTQVFTDTHFEDRLRE